MEKLLIINPGSTSTKIAVYQEEVPLFVESISHSAAELAEYGAVMEQLSFRKALILGCLEARGVDLTQLTGIVARGGVLPPLQAGAYRVNADMVWQLREAPVQEHASNLGAVIAYELGETLCIPAFIYDGVTVDEMLPVLKITGLPGIERKGIGHNLNTRAAAMRYAREQGKPYGDCRLIVVHLGGGISVTLHHGGRVADIINDEDGPFAPERAGGLPSQSLISYMEANGLTGRQMIRRMKSQGGLVAHLGVNDMRVVEEMIVRGDEKAALIYRAMALNVARKIGEEAATVAGDVEAIILTGGIAHSAQFTALIQEKVEWIAPVIVYAGENEMESLALGGLRVLRREEPCHEYIRNGGNI